MSISYYSDMVRHFIKLKGLKNSSLIGISISGHIILYHALHFPSTIKNAVVVGSVGVDREMRWYDHVEYAFLWNDFVLKRILTPKKFKKIWTQQFACSQDYDDEYETMPIFQDRIEYKHFIDSFNHSISGIFFTSLRAQVKDITVPMLIIWGGKDSHHKIRDAYYLKEQVVGSKLAVSPECGHMLSLDDPEFFNRALRNFLETGDPGVEQYTLEEVLEIGSR